VENELVHIVVHIDITQILEAFALSYSGKTFAHKKTQMFKKAHFGSFALNLEF
jgi:hypothetical protein